MQRDVPSFFCSTLDENVAVRQETKSLEENVKQKYE